MRTCVFAVFVSSLIAVPLTVIVPVPGLAQGDPRARLPKMLHLALAEW